VFHIDFIRKTFIMSEKQNKGGQIMNTFHTFLHSIEDESNRKRIEEVLLWVKEQFPQLSPEIKWNQPMFTHHGTFIIGFSVAKKHLAVAPEKVTIEQFSDVIKRTGYSYTNQLIRIKWNEKLDYSLLHEIIQFNIEDKKDCTTFWRKE